MNSASELHYSLSEQCNSFVNHGLKLVKRSILLLPKNHDPTAYKWWDPCVLIV